MLEAIRKVFLFVWNCLLTGVVVSWNGAIISVLWNWFVAPAIGQPAISLGTGIGLILLFFLGRVLTVATWPEASFDISFGNAKVWMVKWLVAPLMLLFLGAAVHFGIGTVILM